MNQWIAFLRGINVGGRNILPMKDLKALLKEIGCNDILTYIQSGNVVFSHKEHRADVLEEKITAAIAIDFDFDPKVMLLSADQLNAAMEGNPFPSGEGDPKTLHLFFLNGDAVDIDLHTMDALKNSSESYQLTGHVFYLHAPDGIGRSKLAAKVEKCLGVPVTARNWRTVEKVLQLATG